MKNNLKILLGGLIVSTFVFSQQPTDLSFPLLSTQTSTQPPALKFNWKSLQNTKNIKVYRKLPTENYFNESCILATLAGNDTTFTDNNLTEGSPYDYMLQSYDSNDKILATNYIHGAINLAMTDYKGKIIVVVDSLFSEELAMEINRLCDDMRGDGWFVIKKSFLRSASAQTVKDYIKTEFLKDKETIRSVFLLGHIAVPYSGNFAPDGHPDHLGAWPCDGYYADMTGEWTDSRIYNSAASDNRNKNIPGDGKFDQSFLPSTLELETGRVDFYNLPLFSRTETELMRQYLNKNHNYRHKITSVKQQAVIKDLFGYFGGESFSSCGWRNFAAMFPAQDIQRSEYITSTLSAEPYLWSYASSPGNYTSCMYVVQSSDFATRKIGAVFNMFFGSYFGDWDSENNLMRSALASEGYGLTCSWAGRPYNIMHHMAMGYHIGKSMLITMRNNANYMANIYYGSVALALMGDPTLRMHVVCPVSEVVSSRTDNGYTINWKKSKDHVMGYYVYRYDSISNNYLRLNKLCVADTFYMDSCKNNNPEYMVKAAKTEFSNSGSYINLSQGIIAQNTFKTDLKQKSVESIAIFPNPVYNRSFSLTNQNHTQHSKIEIIDLNGQKVYERTICDYSTFITLPNTVQAGTYIVQVKETGTATNSKVIIIR